MANPKNAAWYGNDLGAFLVPGAGDIFFVDGIGGLNTNDGLGVDTPFLDITYALTQCATDNNDYIIVLRYPADGSAAEANYPINITKNRVHIIGGSFPYLEADKYAFLGADSDNEIFNIQAQWVEIAYLKLAGGVSHAAIEFTGDGPTNKGFAIHHNTINQKYGTNGFPAYGIWMEQPSNAHVANWGMIAYNRFGPSHTSNAIWINANPVLLRIHHNLFHLPAAIAVNMDGPMAYCEVTDNQFSLLTDTTGMAITFTANCYVEPEVAYIDGNRAHHGATQMGQNPYRDLSPVGTGKQNWGLNYAGTAPIYPVTV